MRTRMFGTKAGIVVALAAMGLGSHLGCGGSSDDCITLGTCGGPELGVGGDGATSSAGGSDLGGGDQGGAAEGGGGEGGEGGGHVTPCTPGETPANGGCLDAGIFVRVSGDDTNDGTSDAPVATINHAAELAVAQGKAIYACAEIFDEEVVLPPGVTLYGALDCDDGWAYTPAEKTTIAPVAGGAVPLVLLGSSDPALTTVVEDVAFIAPDASAPGQSSIAAQAREAKATLSRCLFSAGNAAAGAPGADAASTPPPAAPAGNDAQPGACSDNSLPVSLGGATTINPGCFAAGGKGGNGAPAPNFTGTAGSNGSLGGSGTGIGGPPQPTSGAWSCPNINGAHGDDGAPGAGAAAISFLSPEGSYSGSSGKPGSVGAPGVGGGGGGGRLVKSCPGFFFATGPGGGSGGAGGCGGSPGLGGGYGGSSFAIVSVSSELTLVDSEIVAGAGGSGGAGGAGQPGAAGGLGGKWGGANLIMPVGCPSAGNGGKGGNGGAGGPGGGGSGGHSAAIVHVGAAPTLVGATLNAGAAGAGGVGGPGSTAASEGAPGSSAVLMPMMMP